jgi:hypothetical protein
MTTDIALYPPTSSSSSSSPLSPPPPPISPGIQPTIKDYIAFHGMLCYPSQARKCVDSFTGAILFADQSVYDKLMKWELEQKKKGDVSLLLDTSTSVVFDKLFSPVDFSRNVLPLSVPTYYLLVLATWTGLCTWLGCTTLHCQRPESQCFTSLRPTTNTATKTTTTTGSSSSSSSSSSSTKDNEDNNDNYIIHSECRPQELRLPPSVISYLLARSTLLHNNNNNNSNVTQPPQHHHNHNSNSKNAPPILQQVRLVQRLEFDFGGYLTAIMFHFECSNGYKHLVETYQFHHSSIILGAIAQSTLTLANQVLEPLLRYTLGVWNKKAQ